jgi:integrase/recombinase XerC
METETMASVPALRRSTAGAIRPTVLPDIRPLDLYDALLVESASPNTRISRISDVKILCEFLREPDPAKAVATLVAHGRGKCNAIGMAWRSWLQRERGNSPQSVNRRMSLLRTLVALARRLDLIDWVADIPSIPKGIAPARDVRGPERGDWMKFWAHLVKRGDGPTAVRDRAMYATMFDTALRVAETVDLELTDLDLANGQIWVKGKGRHGTKQWRSISPRAVELIRQWVAIRGDLPGALFCAHPERTAKVPPALFARIEAMVAEGMTHRAIAARLNAEGYRTPKGVRWSRDNLREQLVYGVSVLRHIPTRRVWYALQRLSEEAGLERMIRPHGIRHASITRALDLTDGNVRDVQKFARHSNVQTTMAYDDRRTDPSPDIARMLGDDDEPV